MTEDQLLDFWNMRPRLISRAMRVLGRKYPYETAEDVVSEVALRFIRLNPTITSSMANYSSRAIRNQALMLKRSWNYRETNNCEILEEPSVKFEASIAVRQIEAAWGLSKFDAGLVSQAWPPHCNSTVDSPNDRLRRLRAIEKLQKQAARLEARRSLLKDLSVKKLMQGDRHYAEGGIHGELEGGGGKAQSRKPDGRRGGKDDAAVGRV